MCFPHKINEHDETEYINDIEYIIGQLTLYNIEGVVSMRIGYLIEYSKKKGIFQDFGPSETIICSKAKLIEILQDTFSCVWTAKWINIDEYLKTHKDSNVKVYE